VFENIRNKILKTTTADTDFIPPLFPDELEFDRDFEMIFEDLKHLEMLNRSEKIQYIEAAWEGLEPEITTEIKKRMSKLFPGFNIDNTTINPE
jgi:hypothetical protein